MKTAPANLHEFLAKSFGDDDNAPNGDTTNGKEPNGETNGGDTNGPVDEKTGNTGDKPPAKKDVKPDVNVNSDPNGLDKSGMKLCKCGGMYKSGKCAKCGTKFKADLVKGELPPALQANAEKVADAQDPDTAGADVPDLDPTDGDKNEGNLAKGIPGADAPTPKTTYAHDEGAEAEGEPEGVKNDNDADKISAAYVSKGLHGWLSKSDESEGDEPPTPEDQKLDDDADQEFEKGYLDSVEPYGIFALTKAYGALNLSKAMGPFIGPHGGKWADPAHKVPWSDKKHAGKPAPTAKPHDEHAAEDLHLTAHNESALHGQHEAIRANLVNKMASGVYDHAQATKLFGHMMKRASDLGRKNGGPAHDVATRNAAAKMSADQFAEEAKNGEHDRLLNKKNAMKVAKHKMSNPEGSAYTAGGIDKKSAAMAAEKHAPIAGDSYNAAGKTTDSGGSPSKKAAPTVDHDLKPGEEQHERKTRVENEVQAKETAGHELSAHEHLILAGKHASSQLDPGNKWGKMPQHMEAKHMKAAFDKVKSSGGVIGKTSSGKEVNVNHKAGDTNDFSAKDHEEAFKMAGALHSASNRAANKPHLRGQVGASNNMNDGGGVMGHHMREGKAKGGFGGKYNEPTFAKSISGNGASTMNAKNLHDFLEKAGIPYASDTSGGDSPADDLPKDAPALDQGDDVNGALSQAGKGGGNVGQDRSMDGVDGGSGVGKGGTQGNGPGKSNTVAATAGGTGPTETEKLSPDDSPLGEMNEGTPGLISTPTSSGNSAMRTDLTKSQGFVGDGADQQVRLHDARVAWQKQQSTDVHVPPNAQRAPQRAAAPQAPRASTYVQKGGMVAYSDASDLAVEAMMKASESGFSVPISQVGIAGSPMAKSWACPNCNGHSSAMVTLCTHCGFDAQSMAKSGPVSQALPARLQRAKTTADIYLPVKR